MIGDFVEGRMADPILTHKYTTDPFQSVAGREEFGTDCQSVLSDWGKSD